METLQRLGFPPTTKLLIIHADDAGLSHAENQATISTLLRGSINSYSIMPPCAGFGEMAAFAKANPQYDCGVHLTLTCEWKEYRWPTVLPTHEVPSLINKQGYMHSTRTLLNTHATMDDIEKELRAQILKVYDAGVKPTHLDCHMYALSTTAEYIALYKQLGRDFQLPVLLNRNLIKGFTVDDQLALSPHDLCVDHILIGNFEVYEKGALIDHYEQAIDSIERGLSIMLTHPAFAGEEMEAITHGHPNFGAAWRQLDHDFFTSDRCKELLENNEVTLITWAEIRNKIYCQK